MQKGHKVLLVDVGSASVGTCIAEVEKDGRLVLSYVRRTALQNVSGQNTSAIATLAIDALKKNLESLKTASPGVKQAHVVLAAPWYQASIKSISSESQKTLRITQGTVQKAVDDYTAKQAKDLSGTQIESVVSQAYVNGYPTALLGPVHGSSLKINLYESSADAPFLKSVEEALRAGFAGIKTSFHSFPFAGFTVLRNIRDEQGFVFADVGGEITDLAIVSRDGMSFTGSFPVGSLSIARTIAGKGSIADATSRMTLFARGDLSEKESTEFGALFEKAVAPWNAGYQELLQHASLLTPLPNTTFLVSDKEELRWFERALSFAKSPFPIRPVLVTPDFFQNIVAVGEEGSYDAFLSIAGLYALAIKK